jgi:predicted TPR repeat methyltransferase
MNLGNMMMGLGDNEGGATAYERVTTLAPEMWQGWFNRATCLRRLRRLEEAVECLKTAISLKPDHDLAYERLGMILYRAGKTKELAELYGDWVKYNPDNPTARHMYAAAAGEAVPDRASDDYVRKTFDGFADTFDENLLDLGYRAPQLLADALERHLGPAADREPLEILDAGAGTGLCGPLRERARRPGWTSPGMLEKARARRATMNWSPRSCNSCAAGRPVRRRPVGRHAGLLRGAGRGPGRRQDLPAPGRTTDVHGRALGGRGRWRALPHGSTWSIPACRGVCSECARRRRLAAARDLPGRASRGTRRRCAGDGRRGQAPDD